MSDETLFEDNFEKGLSHWKVSSDDDVRIINSEDKLHGNVLVLQANGNVSALLKDSGGWGAVRVEGEMLFPEDVHNYLGLIYNYTKTQQREDFGLLYVKGNGSYIRANPWRDGNVSRLLYEEFFTPLGETQAIKIAQWHKFKMEVFHHSSHLYVGDMSTPKITFDLFEFPSGQVGFQPRVAGGDVWIDNVKVTSINNFSYTGASLPDTEYHPNALITEWEVIGPFTRPVPEIEKNEAFESGSSNDEVNTWRSFSTDKRGAVISGRVTEYEGERSVAYFRTAIQSESERQVKIHFSTADELALYLNGKFQGFVYRDGYNTKDNDWNVWFDFWHNPEHQGRKVRLKLKAGENHLVIRVRNGQFASGGFFAQLED
jgi:hypothetical protein